MAKQIKDDSINELLNLITEGTILKGDIVAKGKTRIDGELVGNIVAEEKLVIGPNGKITGEIRCYDIENYGFLKGKVTAKDLVALKASSKIEGDIIAGKLSVESGAVLTGTFTVGVVKIPSEPNKIIKDAK